MPPSRTPPPDCHTLRLLGAVVAAIARKDNNMKKRSLETTPKSMGYSACILLITERSHEAAQAHLKVLSDQSRKSADDLAYIAGWSDALRATQALALPPYDKRNES